MSHIFRNRSLRASLAAVLTLLAAASISPTLAGEPTGGNGKTLKGIVASVDERNDSISLRLQSPATGETTEDFKVQDGLIFNAVRFGDAVVFSVETIEGAKTITRLTKE